ncbi:MAG: 8-amino-7-oxononanoate synthase [Xanthobacteraceae bacterium]|nr:8-amino-7-oxononanoate synthase [Xanthobacteraceae bacterium]
MHSLDEFARTKLAALASLSLRRELVTTDRVSATEVMRHGRRLVSFSCNDYLGLAHDPRIKAAAAEAVARYGAGAGASRLVSGNHPLLEQVEARLARRKGKQAALVFGSGYLANIGLPGAFAGTGDLILIDELAHASMHAGARLSGARVLTFRHNDLHHLADLLAHERPAVHRVLILTERIFSMDGDQAPLSHMVQLADRNNAWVLADDAHGLGVAEHDGDVPLDMGTLSKALGSYGGYVCASEPVIALLHSRARSFVYSTGLPPASAAAALAALDVMDAEPERCARPRLLARRFAQALHLPAPASAIVPLIVGEAERVLSLSTALERAGFLVVAIRPPTVPAGRARLRFTFSAAHTDRQVDTLIDAVTNIMSTQTVLAQP